MMKKVELPSPAITITSTQSEVGLEILERKMEEKMRKSGKGKEKMAKDCRPTGSPPLVTQGDTEMRDRSVASDGYEDFVRNCCFPQYGLHRKYLVASRIIQRQADLS